MIHFTEQAKQKALEIIKDEGFPEPVFLRVRVLGGGCAGFQYDMYFDELPPTEFDEQFETGCGFKVVCDPLSLQYLDGVEIDYTWTEFAEGFKFNNPNISSQCGCGSSFAV